MSNIEIVIKISEADYKCLQKKDRFNDRFLDYYEKLIVYGKQLPKEHGRLDDLDALREEVSSWGMNDYEPSDFIDAIDQIDTIIEADKENIKND